MIDELKMNGKGIFEIWKFWFLKNGQISKTGNWIGIWNLNSNWILQVWPVFAREERTDYFHIRTIAICQWFAPKRDHLFSPVWSQGNRTSIRFWNSASKMSKDATKIKKNFSFCFYFFNLQKFLPNWIFATNFCIIFAIEANKNYIAYKNPIQKINSKSVTRHFMFTTDDTLPKFSGAFVINSKDFCSFENRNWRYPTQFSTFLNKIIMVSSIVKAKA